MKIKAQDIPTHLRRVVGQYIDIPEIKRLLLNYPVDFFPDDDIDDYVAGAIGWVAETHLDEYGVDMSTEEGNEIWDAMYQVIELLFGEEYRNELFGYNKDRKIDETIKKILRRL